MAVSYKKLWKLLIDRDMTKTILWSKRCKDEALRGTVKETIMQVSRSKKWGNKPVLDADGKPMLNSKGKQILKSSYSVLQDDFFQYIRSAGYTDVERGERFSTEEHLTITQFKVMAEKNQWFKHVVEEQFITIQEQLMLKGEISVIILLQLQQVQFITTKEQLILRAAVWITTWQHHMPVQFGMKREQLFFLGQISKQTKLGLQMGMVELFITMTEPLQ